MRRGYQFFLLFSLIGLAPNAHAFLGLERFWSPKEAPRAKMRTPVNLPGYKVKVFKFQKAEVADVELPLQNYLTGIKSQGSMVADKDANSLIVTDDPEVLQRLERIIREMDQVYNNTNPMARRMLASQAMIKAVRNYGFAGVVTRSSGSSSPVGGVPGKGQIVGVPQPAPGPVQGFTPSDVDDNAPVSRAPKLLEERPPIRGYQLVGWVRDSEGLLVVLRNDGQRYVYRGGRLRYGSAASTNYVAGLTVTIRGDHIVFSDPSQGTSSLSLKPVEARLK